MITFWKIFEPFNMKKTSMINYEKLEENTLRKIFNPFKHVEKNHAMKRFEEQTSMYETWQLFGQSSFRNMTTPSIVKLYTHYNTLCWNRRFTTYREIFWRWSIDTQRLTRKVIDWEVRLTKVGPNSINYYIGWVMKVKGLIIPMVIKVDYGSIKFYGSRTIPWVIYIDDHID